MQNISDYFGQLVNRAFGAVKAGAGTVSGALDNVATAIKPAPPKVTGFASPLADNYLQAEPEPTLPPSTPADVQQQRIRDYYASALGPKDPGRQNLDQYFPALQALPYMFQKEQEFNRPGLGALLALQAFFESTGGRLSKNVYGTLKGGEGGEGGVGTYFNDVPSAIDYQTGPNVLGGGANPNMNILSRQGPIGPQEVTNLYQSYNPSGDYLQQLLDALSTITAQ